MSQKAKPIPDGMHSLTPHITVRDCAKAIEFYKQAFGAKEPRSPATMPDGRIMHAHLIIGDSNLMLNDAFPEKGGAAAPSGSDVPYTLHFYCDDADAVFKRAVSLGATVKMPVTDMFWGDRYGQLQDPFGYRWAIATHVEDVSPNEADRRAKAMFSKPMSAHK